MGMVPPQGIGAPVPPWDLQGQLKGHSLELGTELYGGSCLTGKVQVRAWKTRHQLHLPLSLQSPAGAPIAQTQPEARRQG